MNTKENTMMEIDILALLRRIWSKKFLILFVSLLFGVTTFFGSMFLISPKYTATTRIYVVNQNSQNNLTAQDLQAGTYLVSDYKEIITSREVLTAAIVDNKLQLSPEQLAKELTVTIPSDTRVISISVTERSPKRASKIANSIRKIASEKIKNVTKVQDVTTLERAEVPEKPSSPNIKRNTLLGFIFGIILTIIVIITREVLDDRVKSSDDVEEILGMTLLGIIPDVNKL
ncbi:MAG: Wzz/FepE/Etk N-terminal domain-containing protein [Streptococcus sp.]|nr:Wzz/FepE/Etk N-terminal domain-containing protein [Streptococcus sp.]